MHPEFNARRSAVSRLYHYVVGLDDESRSPFRRRYELPFPHSLDRPALDSAAAVVVGEHCFRAFAVAGTAPADDDHTCRVAAARWTDRREGAVVVFEIEANRFLHHMVRFLVGTMLDVATGRRPAGDVPRLLAAAENSEVSAPAPPHALFLERVTYPEGLYRNP
jgi:tRNA pseudouridine38-40 synthase